MQSAPRRYETDDDFRKSLPIHVVWETTLACNLKCQHCGSRAGKKREGELSTTECRGIIRQLADLGVRQVTFIGGEAYLRRDWVELIKCVRDHGMDCSIQTGGRALTEDKIRAARDAGLNSCGVSIDGLAELHDRLRGVPGAFDQAIRVLEHLKTCNIISSVNTQITAEIMPQLRDLMYRIIAAGVKQWQIQLTVAMGNAADHSELLLQPYQLLDLMPLLADMHKEAMDLGLLIQPGNNIGYFGPYEHSWRIVDESKGHWQGCVAGQTGIGIEADGTIKGCPSLPTAAYAGGNVRDMSIKQMCEMSEQLRFTRDRTVDDLWGYCRTCYYADVCRAGCTWTGHVLFGRAGNNPYCHYRALDLDKRGLRERLVKVEDASGKPFDHGRFDLLLESKDGSGAVRAVAVPPPLRATPDPALREGGRIPPTLDLCRGCHQYVWPDTVICPHCGGDVATSAARYAADLSVAKAAYSELQRRLEDLGMGLIERR